MLDGILMHALPLILLLVYFIVFIYVIYRDY